ncbi:MAG TPA: hypothetical protein VJ505_00260 [Holophagaceae bacterium]|nr:hypothetical protein [Holophagaceae bacterium]
MGLHGTGGTPRLMARFSNLPHAALERGWALALPAALGAHGQEDPATGAAWNVGPGLGHPAFNQVDDVGFLKALPDLLNLPPSPTFLAGFSNGARMGWRLLLEGDAPYAGYALLSGAPNGPIPARVRRQPVAIFHGLEDQHIPYAGGVGTQGRKIQCDPAPESAHRLALAMGLDPKPRRRLQGTHTWDRYGDEVHLWTLAQGHAWPGGRKYGPDADEPAPDVDASAWILDFFSERLP